MTGPRSWPNTTRSWTRRSPSTAGSSSSTRATARSRPSPTRSREPPPRSAISRALADQPWPGEARPRLRMGLHAATAQLTADRADYLGLDVHYAARLTGAANGGQILLSDSAFEGPRRGCPGRGDRAVGRPTAGARLRPTAADASLDRAGCGRRRSPPAHGRRIGPAGGADHVRRAASARWRPCPASWSAPGWSR